MVMLCGMYVLISALLFLLILGALIDIITRPDSQVKHLPKVVWVLLVIFIPLIGSIIWFAVGREYGAPGIQGSFGARVWRDRSTRPRSNPHQSGRSMSGIPSPITPGKYQAVSRTRSTEEELAELEREIEFHRKLERVKQLETEIEARSGNTE